MKRISVIILITVLFTLSAATVSAVTEGVRVSTPDTCWFQGTFINLPVQIEWTTWSRYINNCPGAEYDVPPPADPCATLGDRCRDCGSGDDEICSFEMELSFNKSKMQAVTVTGADLIDDWHWPDVYFEINNNTGTINIAGASANCAFLTSLTDPENLIYVGFLITGRPGDDTNLEIVSFKYNEVNPQYVYWGNDEVTGYADAKSVGDLVVCEHLCLSGNVTYCNTDMPICGADVTLKYIPDVTHVIDPPDIDDTTVTTNCDGDCGYDCRGTYNICDIVGGYNYCLTVWKDSDYNDAISAFDASLILRYIVNQLALNCCQKIAADVSGDCCVSAYDASLIMKHLIGDAAAYPYFPKKAAEGTNWIFFDEGQRPHNGCPADDDCLCPVEEICHLPLARSWTGQDFKAIILGDVSGNWGLGQNRKNAPLTTSIAFQASDITNDKLSLLISVKGDAVYASEFAISYPSCLEFVDARPAAGNDDWHVLSSDRNGLIKVVAAGVTATSGAVVELIFTRIESLSDIGEIALNDPVLDEVRLSGSVPLMGLSNQMIPGTFYLGDNYPNPFNPTTTISFGLPITSEIQIDIFNVLGQRIRTLISSRYDIGHHTVTWNGTDDSHSPVASGIYFYRLQAGDLTMNKKMVLMK